MKEPPPLSSIPRSTTASRRQGACSSLASARRRMKRDHCADSATLSLEEGCTGIRFNRGPGGRLLDPSRELEVLKCIMLREGYLARVRCLAEEMVTKAKKSLGQRQTLPAGLTDLLDLLRVATLDTVEAITLWRLSQADPTPKPFMWNGSNYLMKVLHDCDFLDRMEALRRWFGFRLRRNPFFFPRTSSGEETEENSSDAPQNAEAIQFDKTNLVDVGQQPWSGPLELPAGHSQDRTGRDGKIQRKNRLSRNNKAGRHSNSLAPYIAAVVNDPSLLPTSTFPVRGASAPVLCAADATGSGLHLTAFVDTQGLVPNIVSRDDVARIPIATNALVEEEIRVRGAAETSRDIPCSAATAAGVGGGAAYQSSARATSAGDAKFRRKRKSHKRAGEEIAKQGTGSIAAWSSGPDGNSRSNAIRQGNEVERSLTLTAAGVLQVPAPEPHPGLGPILLRSNRPGGDEQSRPFLHTVARTAGIPLAYAATGTKGLHEPATEGPVPNDEVCMRRSTTPTDPSSPCEDWCAPFGTLSRSSSAMFRGPSALSPTTCTDTIAIAKDEPEPIRSDQPTNALHGGANAQKFASRALQKAGAELIALSGAGTTGRRNPPPREVRLRRLARDVRRHTAELHDLEQIEQRLCRSLSRLESIPNPTDRKAHLDLTDHDVKREETCDSFGAFLDALTNSQRSHKNTSANEMLPRSNSNLDMETLGNEVQNASETALDMQSEDVGNERASVAASRHEGGNFPHGDMAVSNEVKLAAIRRIKALLEDKQRDIDLKRVDLRVKREQLACLRSVQKQAQGRQQALDLERRRTRLRQGEILPEDNFVAEKLDHLSATSIQRRCRGIWARKYAAWYKNSVHEAATVIQRGVRCVWDRRATARCLLLNASSRTIQAVIRMFVKRNQYVRLLRLQKVELGCRKIQKVGRGMRGRRRAAARRSMMAAAKKAVECVSLDNLEPRDLSELASVIHAALVDPLRALPPPGVLGALRVALTILDSTDKEQDGIGEVDTVTFQTALGRNVQGVVWAPELTWEMAARVLDRPFRLLRRMRAFASGLGAAFDRAPIRLLRLPPQAVGLLSAYRGDPAWSTEALMSMPKGGKTACAFVEWARALGRVSDDQLHVQDFLRDAQPAWLRKSRCLQRRRRALELCAESCRSAVAVAIELQDELRNQGLAYGDPMLALEILERRVDNAERDLRELKDRTEVFLATQAAAEAAEGRALMEDAEFAEREASVAARAERMTRRTGIGKAEALAECERKTRGCEVALRERRRLVRLWERRRRQGSQPLFDEWIPPPDEQFVLARSLGAARAWVEILRVKRARIIENAGGSTFVKGLTGDQMDEWTCVCEHFDAYCADVESGEGRAADLTRRFELEVLSANEEEAAKKVSCTLWDNATDETKNEERMEDLQAALNERQIAMGAALPPGLIDSGSISTQAPGTWSHQSSLRPTLVLLGLDLPTSVRNGIRAQLDTDAPGLFGLHVSGVDALPLAAAAARRRGRGFFAPSPELSSYPPEYLPGTGAILTPQAHQLEEDTGGDEDPAHAGRDGALDCDMPADSKQSKAQHLQAALSAGQNVSLDVLPGPGVCARRRFLRDLEALLGGIDGCGGHSGSAAGGAVRGPTVVLVRGHHGNRSGGGEDIRHGTGAEVTAQKPCEGDVGAENKAAGAAEAETRRVKSILEVAAQCLHDLYMVHGQHPNPFAVPKVASATPQQRTVDTQVHHKEYTSTGRENKARPHLSLSAGGNSVLEILLAACHMLMHPCHRYPVTEDDHMENSLGNSRDGDLQPVSIQAPTSENDVKQSYIHRLAEVCRNELAESQTARVLAELLLDVDLISVPFETALALRRLVQHRHWPSTSPRPSFAWCCTLEAFSGWAVAAVNAAMALSLMGGGEGETESDRTHAGEQANCEESAERKLEFPGGQEIDWVGPVVVGTPKTAICGSIYGETSIMTGEGSARIRERESIERLQRLLVHEDVSIVDDDLPCFPSRSQRKDAAVNPNHRICQASEAFGAVMDTTLRPFQVYEEAERFVPFEDRTSSPENSTPHSAADVSSGMWFRVRVSKAFRSVYVRASPVDADGALGGRAVTARVHDDALIDLLSANWTEKFDLSVLRNLSSAPAVWKALVDTLVLQLPKVPKSMKIATDHTNGNAEKTSNTSSQTSPDMRTRSVVALRSAGGSYNAISSGLGSLCFRHSRQPTLETVCLLVGIAVPVTLFEESRTDFWCEGRVPSGRDGNGGCTVVGLRVPKECIPFLLGEGHPMHMRTTLQVSDVRELCALIADRLKLCLASSCLRRGRHCYRCWMDCTIGGNNGSEQSFDNTKGIGFAGTIEGGTLRLSLRKRGEGQVVFSRLVTLITSGIAVKHGSTDLENEGMGQRRSDQQPQRYELSVQRLVTIKEYSHRGAQGELYAEIRNISSGKMTKRISLPPELTRLLLAGRTAQSMKDKTADATDRLGAEPSVARTSSRGGNGAHSLTRYWRDAIAWRVRPSPARDADAEATRNEHSTWTFANGRRSSNSPADGDEERLVIDEREPVFVILSIPIRTVSSHADAGDPNGSPCKTYSHLFDLLLLPAAGVLCGTTKSSNFVEFVLIHRATMAGFRCNVRISAIIEATSGLALASLAAPASLASELRLPASSLRDLVGGWLTYSTSDGGWTVGDLTLSIPGTHAVHIGPYNGLRGDRTRALGGRSRGRTSIRQRTPQAAQSAPRKRASGIERESGVIPETHSKQRNLTCEMCTSAQQQKASVGTLAVEKRNERMVFSRKLPIPLLHASVEPRTQFLAGRLGQADIKMHELTISVFEVFTTGEDNRVERSLKLHARDETARPPLEGTKRIAWTGSCAGLEGGAVWRLVTEGLRFQRIRNDRRNVAALLLDVARPGDIPDSPGANAIEGMRDGSPRQPVAASDPPRTDGVNRDQEERRLSYIVSPVLASDRNVSKSTSCQPPSANSAKIYEGWHRITGVRLHVLCFQEEALGLSHRNDTCSRGTSRTPPAGRGGVIGLPCGASLRFIVCDPRDGYRSEMWLSADDIHGNSSHNNGTVDADLLREGRRPALAKAIANTLRLVFGENGRYRVTLPLSSRWART